MTIHHLQLWVPDLGRAERSWGWLLERLGYEPYRRFEHGVAWRTGGVAIVIEMSPDMVPGMLHSRLRPGLNHVAFQAGTPAAVDAIVGESAAHGWSLLEVDGHPLPSGLHVAYLEDADGFEVESSPRSTPPDVRPVGAPPGPPSTTCGGPIRAIA